VVLLPSNSVLYLDARTGTRWIKYQAHSQERLAFDSGVDRSYLGGIERGEENPTVDILERIAEILEIELHELFEIIKNSEFSSGLPRGRKKSG